MVGLDVLPQAGAPGTIRQGEATRVAAIGLEVLLDRSRGGTRRSRKVPDR